MDAKRLVAVICGIGLCTTIAAGIASAENKLKPRAVKAAAGRLDDLDPASLSKAIKKENQRFRKEMKPLRAQIRQLRKEMRKAVQAAEQEADGTSIEAVRQSYQEEAQAIARRIVAARICHQDKIQSIFGEEGAGIEKQLARRILLKPVKIPKSRVKARRVEAKKMRAIKAMPVKAMPVKARPIVDSEE